MCDAMSTSRYVAISILIHLKIMETRQHHLLFPESVVETLSVPVTLICPRTLPNSGCLYFEISGRKAGHCFFIFAFRYLEDGNLYENRRKNSAKLLRSQTHTSRLPNKKDVKSILFFIVLYLKLQRISCVSSNRGLALQNV